MTSDRSPRNARQDRRQRLSAPGSSRNGSAKKSRWADNLPNWTAGTFIRSLLRQKRRKKTAFCALRRTCRVSTDDIDQQVSIKMQIDAYTELIKSNPKWKYAGCYVDDGFSGTNTAHRQGFQKLMKDAMDGKIDMIITKAVSRFARNLMDCIGWVEALQNHDPPIRVFFEQEHLDTMQDGSLMITSTFIITSAFNSKQN